MCLALGAGTLSVNASVLPGQPSPSSWAKGRVLVMPRAGLADAEFAKIVGVHGGRSIGKLGNLNVHVIELPLNVPEDVIASALARHPQIKFAELDVMVPPALYANDPYYGSAWHLQAVQAPAAWDLSLGTGVTVAILDTGVNGTHPDLQAQMVSGWNFWDNNSNTTDVYGHGTEVAGVVAASSNNAAGVTSVAWNAKLMPIRISDTNGYCSWSAIASGISWAADHGAKVANISYMVQSSSTIQAAAQYMNSKGGVVVTAAGNTGAYDGTAASDSLISVSATDSSDNRTSWSTYGPYVDLAAPGVGIWTTEASGGYAAVSGTSFASPLTAAVAALMIAANPGISAADITRLLKSTAVDLGAVGYDQYYGAGRVNAAAAVQAAFQLKSSDTQPPTVSITSPTGGTVTGIVPINVTASDNVGVTRVELLVNGAVVATDITAPFQFSWDSTAAGTAGVTIAARAYDVAGNVGNSPAITVLPANPPAPPTTTAPPDTTPPSVTIASPVDGAQVNGQVTIMVTSSDNVAVANVTIAIDGTVVFTGNARSASYRWSAKKASSGLHTITAVARDTSGNERSTSIHVIR